MRLRAALAILIGLGCEAQPDPGGSAAASAAPAAAATLCPARRSVDPGPSGLGAAEGAFEAKRYGEAQQRYRDLIRKFPASSTLHLRLGDALLYEHQSARDAAAYSGAADRALEAYRRADDLQRQGCALPEREHYYLLLGTAYAHLRKRDAAAASPPLESARLKWPTSAEVPYHQARVACLQEQVDRCADLLVTTLDLARALSRPRFLRTYHSVDDWLRRSQTQSEFVALRKTARYAQIVKTARAR